MTPSVDECGTVVLCRAERKKQREVFSPVQWIRGVFQGCLLLQFFFQLHKRFSPCPFCCPVKVADRQCYLCVMHRLNLLHLRGNERRLDVYWIGRFVLPPLCSQLLVSSNQSNCSWSFNDVIMKFIMFFCLSKLIQSTYGGRLCREDVGTCMGRRSILSDWAQIMSGVLMFIPHRKEVFRPEGWGWCHARTRAGGS